MPKLWAPTASPVEFIVPLKSVQISGTNGDDAKPPSQNWRKYLKSAKTVKYLSQMSRSNAPYRYSRSVAETAGVRSAKLKNARSLPIAAVGPRPLLVYSGSVCWFGNACGVGVNRPLLKAGLAVPKNCLLVTRPAKLPLRASKPPYRFLSGSCE